MSDAAAPDLTEYNFMCFGGKPLLLQCCNERSANYFDMNRQSMSFEQTNLSNDRHKEIPPPKNFELMKELAAALSESFAFVRVDFYEIDERVYFKGMNFTPSAENFFCKSESTDKYFGGLLTLPNPTPPPLAAFSSSYCVRKKFLHEIKFPPPPESLPERKIIASLTSWTKRIGTAHLTIQTILNQTRRPDLTVLYLATDEFPRRENDLPHELLALRSDRFEIRWTKNIRSYKKLIPALKDFPEDLIVTFDDDLLFRPELIERLLVGYKKYPEFINCHIARICIIGEDGVVDLAEKKCIPYDRPTYLNKIASGAACMFPPHCLHEDVFDENKFMTLAPTNDDIWFWLMGVLNARRANLVENNVNILNQIPGSQEFALWRVNNFNERRLFKDLKKIFDAYPVLKEILLYEQRLAKGD